MVGLFTLFSYYTQCCTVLTSQVQNHISQAIVLLFQVKKLFFSSNLTGLFVKKNCCIKETEYMWLLSTTSVVDNNTFLKYFQC